MEYLCQNLEWLKDELDQFDEDDYIVLDCPGQVELYSHLPIMHNLAAQLQMVSVYLCLYLCLYLYLCLCLCCI